MTDDLLGAMRSVAEWLEGAGVPWMIAGSFASTFHGVPRATQDVDIVIDPDRPSLLRFVDSIPAESAYVDRQTALEALARRDMFNVIDMDTGWKFDFIVRKNRPFSRAEFDRRVPIDWKGIAAFVASPEDVVLSKLEWAHRSGGSERQLRDVSGVIEARGDTLDRSYIESWLDALGVRSLWDQVAKG